MTKLSIIPIQNADNQAYFVDRAFLNLRDNVKVDDRVQTSQPLRVGMAFDLFSLVDAGYESKHHLEYIPDEELSIQSVVVQTRWKAGEVTYKQLDVRHLELTFGSTDEERPRLLTLSAHILNLHTQDQHGIAFKLDGQLDTQTGVMHVHVRDYNFTESGVIVEVVGFVLKPVANLHAWN